MMRVGFLILSFWTLSIFSKTNKFILTKQEFEKDNNLSWTNHSPLLTVLWTCKYGSYLNYITDGWEGDYIREIFPPPKFYHTQNQSSSAQIVVYNTMSDLDYLKSYIKTNKVLILIHLSDEYQGLFEIANKGVELYHMVPLVLRHYSFHAFRNLSNPYTNVMQFPLGYMNGMLYNNKTNKTYSSSYFINKLLNKKTYKIKLTYKKSKIKTKFTHYKRSLNWSFIGNKNKSDRQYMLKIFKSWNQFYISNNVTATSMSKIYKKSNFVIVGSGQFTIDCFRIYEALINGAIPVVVANPQEIKFSFDYDGFTPPFLFANTWDDALQTCKNMSLSDIHKRRIEIMKWYLNRLNAVTHRIKYVLDVFSNIPELCTNNGYGLCNDMN